MKSKRGVSPIIAVVLLIAIVVGLGAMLMSMTSSFFRESGEKNQQVLEQTFACSSDVDVKFVKIAGRNACWSSSDLEFNLEAGGFADIGGIQLTAIGDSVQNFDNLEDVDGNTDIPRGFIRHYSVDMGNSSSLEKIVIKPKIFSQNNPEPVICSNAGIELDLGTVSACS